MYFLKLLLEREVLREWEVVELEFRRFWVEMSVPETLVEVVEGWCWWVEELMLMLLMLLLVF